eukprot:Clim_evm10s206 gene=Clim_evmTU10s206
MNGGNGQNYHVMVRRNGNQTSPGEFFVVDPLKTPQDIVRAIHQKAWSAEIGASYETPKLVMLYSEFGNVINSMQDLLNAGAVFVARDKEAFVFPEAMQKALGGNSNLIEKLEKDQFTAVMANSSNVTDEILALLGEAPTSGSEAGSQMGSPGENTTSTSVNSTRNTGGSSGPGGMQTEPSFMDVFNRFNLPYMDDTLGGRTVNVGEAAALRKEKRSLQQQAALVANGRQANQGSSDANLAMPGFGGAPGSAGSMQGESPSDFSASRDTGDSGSPSPRVAANGAGPSIELRPPTSSTSVKKEGGSSDSKASSRIASHKLAEARSRQRLKDAFHDLHMSLPALSGHPQPTKAQIVRAAVSYIGNLRGVVHELERQRDRAVSAAMQMQKELHDANQLRRTNSMSRSNPLLKNEEHNPELMQTIVQEALSEHKIEDQSVQELLTKMSHISINDEVPAGMLIVEDTTPPGMPTDLNKMTWTWLSQWCCLLAGEKMEQLTGIPWPTLMQNHNDFDRKGGQRRMEASFDYCMKYRRTYCGLHMYKPPGGEYLAFFMSCMPASFTGNENVDEIDWEKHANSCPRYWICRQSGFVMVDRNVRPRLQRAIIARGNRFMAKYGLKGYGNQPHDTPMATDAGVLEPNHLPTQPSSDPLQL